MAGLLIARLALDALRGPQETDIFRRRNQTLKTAASVFASEGGWCLDRYE
jgi:hypothetical protein